MPVLLELPFSAPIAVGHTVKIATVARWIEPFLGNDARDRAAGYWEDTRESVVVDVVTGVVYASLGISRMLVAHPLGFTDRSHRLGATVEAVVVACVVGTAHAAVTQLVVEPSGKPQPYR
jgi:hypothetical protein